MTTPGEQLPALSVCVCACMCVCLCARAHVCVCVGGNCVRSVSRFGYHLTVCVYCRSCEISEFVDHVTMCVCVCMYINMYVCVCVCICLWVWRAIAYTLLLCHCNQWLFRPSC